MSHSGYEENERYLNQRQLYKKRRRKRNGRNDIKREAKLFCITFLIMIAVIVIAIIAVGYFDGITWEVR